MSSLSFEQLFFDCLSFASFWRVSMALWTFLGCETTFFFFFWKSVTLLLCLASHFMKIMTTHYITLQHAKNTQTTQTHHATPHQAHSSFQHRYRPTSFEVARGLHRNTWTNFLLDDANMFARQGMIQSTCTLAHRVSQSRVYRGEPTK